MRRFLRSLFTAAAIAAAIQLVAIGTLTNRFPDVVGGPDVQETRRLRLPRAKAVMLQNSNGAVRVRTHDLTDIEVEADIRIYARSRAKTETLASYAESLIQVTPDGDTLGIVSEPEGGAPYAADVTVDYTILVPEETNIGIRSINGNIWVSKGCGSVDVSGQNTDIEIADPAGHVRAKSTNGRVRVTNAPAGATIETVNGNVYVHMLAGTFSASTINGSIVARLLDPRVEQCSLETQNGGITLAMQTECGAAIEAESMQGIVKCDVSDDGKTRHWKRRHYLKTDIDSGHTGRRDGAHTGVRMQSLNGNIWITRNK